MAWFHAFSPDNIRTVLKRSCKFRRYVNCQTGKPLFCRCPGFSSSADRRAAAAHSGRRPRREATALSGAQPGSRVPLQAEAQALGELPGEEGGRADVHERLPHSKRTTHGSLEPGCTLQHLAHYSEPAVGTDVPTVLK